MDLAGGSEPSHIRVWYSILISAGYVPSRGMMVERRQSTQAGEMSVQLMALRCWELEGKSKSASRGAMSNKAPASSNGTSERATDLNGIRQRG